MARKTKRKKSPAAPILIPSEAASLHVEQARPHWTLSWWRALFVTINIVFLVLFIDGMMLDINAMTGTIRPLSETTIRDTHTYEEFRQLSHDITTLGANQDKAGVQVVNIVDLQQQLSAIQVNLQVGQHRQAQFAITQLRQKVTSANAKLADATRPKPLSAANAAAVQLNIPILIYHYTPGDFDALMSELQRKGYHSITLAQLGNGIRGGLLPAKPVVITFDDGFSNQMDAFHILQSHHMVATYYIISGGERSKWCIGADRRPGNCGDSYLNWSEISELDHSGTITIGGHTVDHENLAALPADLQRFEIVANKQTIEQHLGHPITDFAYPYGAFNGTTIQIVREAGYNTAVTTLPGTIHTPGTIYTLHRVRDVHMLP